MKNLGVLSSKGLFLGLTSLGKARQGISGGIGISLEIVNSKMVNREFLGPSDLPGTQALGIHESAKIVIVGEDEDLVFAALQVVAPSLEVLNDGQ